MLLHAVQMQHDGPERRIIAIGEPVDDGVQGVAAHNFVIDARGVDEGGVVLGGEQRVGEVAEELLE